MDADRVVKISGDELHPLTNGFTCTKGRHLADFHTDPSRLRNSQRRLPDGEHEDIAVDTALAEIAARLGDIIAEHGPECPAETRLRLCQVPTRSPRHWHRSIYS